MQEATSHFPILECLPCIQCHHQHHHHRHSGACCCRSLAHTEQPPRRCPRAPHAALLSQPSAVLRAARLLSLSLGVSGLDGGDTIEESRSRTRGGTQGVCGLSPSRAVRFRGRLFFSWLLARARGGCKWSAKFSNQACRAVKQGASCLVVWHSTQRLTQFGK